MKTSLFFVLFLCSTLYSFGQYSRSIYAAEANSRRHSSIVSDGVTTQGISIRESSNDTLRVTLFDIDDSGETSNYRKYEFSPFAVSSAYALSGAGMNASGNATLCVLNPDGPGAMNIGYITIDPTTGAFSNYSTLNGQYRQGFTRSRAKGDNLISYFAKISGTGIERVERSMSSTNTSFEDADLSSTYSGSMFQNGVKCELLTIGSIEYLATANKIIKRNSSNNYIQTSYQGAFNAPCLTETSSASLFVLNRSNTDYIKLGSNLNTLSTGSIPEIQGNPHGLLEIYALPNDEIRIWSSRNEPEIFDINENGIVVNRQDTRNFPLDQLSIGGKQYVIGMEGTFVPFINTDGIPYQNNATALTIVSDDLSSIVPDFIEYDQFLSSDKIRFHVNHLGESFRDIGNSDAGFSFYQNDIFRSLIYTAGSSAIGTAISGTLLGSSVFSVFDNSELAPGPYSTPGNYDMETMDKYNRGYYVTNEMIESHIIEITSGNPAYEIPFGIREWPAHGDVSLGQAANLASFIDQNGNGQYEPEIGDYPAIYGNQCLLNIYHEHPNSPLSASIETHQYYFTFDCDMEEAEENAVFVRSHKFSRDQLLFNTYAGNNVDFDIGNPYDDYAGTNVELGMTYAYNSDLYDEDSLGHIGFHDTIPAMGLLALQGVKLDTDGTDNPNAVDIPANGSINGIGFGDNIVDNEYFTMESSYIHTQSVSIAQNAIPIWKNIMLGLTPFGYYKSVSGAIIKHDFFGTSDPLFYTSGGANHGNSHSESSFADAPGNRYVSSASGPGTFTVTDTMVLINAYVVGVDTVNLSPENSLLRLFENGQTLRDFYAQNSDDCGNTFDIYLADNVLETPEEELQQILLYPNPANNSFRAKGIQGTTHLQIIDLNGRVVSEAIDFKDGQEISIQELENAIYLVSIEDKRGKQVIRLVKQ